MKKFAITMMAVLAMFAGAACGGGNDSSSATKIGESSSITREWSDANKARLLLSLVKMDGKDNLLTKTQQDCMYEWFMAHYKNMDEVEADTTSSPDALFSACGL